MPKLGPGCEEYTELFFPFIESSAPLWYHPSSLLKASSQHTRLSPLGLLQQKGAEAWLLPSTQVGCEAGSSSFAIAHISARSMREEPVSVLATLEKLTEVKTLHHALRELAETTFELSFNKCFISARRQS